MWNDAYSTEQNQFDRLGHPGRILSVYTYTGGQVDFTGSNYGYGAVRVVDPGDTTNDNVITLSGGGQVLLDDISSTGIGIVPLSVSQISGSTAGGTKVYVFKVQGTV